MIKLTATDLNLMTECPRCFWRKVNKGLYRPSHPFPSFLNEMEACIKDYYDKYREQGILPPLLEGKIKGKLLSPKPKSIGITEGEVNLWGIPDEYVDEDGKIVILDHKTRNGPPNTAHPAHQLQMEVYTYILERKGAKVTDKAYLIYYCPEPGEIHQGLNIKTTIKTIKLNTERIPKLLEKAKEILEAEEPNKGCEWCGGEK